MIELVAHPLTPDGFAPFGQVCAPAEVQGRLDHIARLHNTRPQARANLFLARSGVVMLPHDMARLEQHPASSQSFLPFGDGPMLVVCAPSGPDGGPDMAGARAFLARGQGFSYDAGVWHSGVAGIGAPIAVAGFMWEDGSAQDCVFAAVPPFRVLAEG